MKLGRRVGSCKTPTAPGSIPWAALTPARNGSPTSCGEIPPLPGVNRKGVMNEPAALGGSSSGEGGVLGGGPSRKAIDPVNAPEVLIDSAVVSLLVRFCCNPNVTTPVCGFTA